MNRRAFVQRSAITAAGFGILRNVQACAPAPAPPPIPMLPEEFRELRERFFIFQLQRNPVTSTYLGGDAYSSALSDTGMRLRDFRPGALEAEIRFYRDARAGLARVPPASLTPQDRIDLRLMRAQLEFLIHQLEDLRYYQQSLDTYVGEAFHGVDWQIQQMQPLEGTALGTEEEWQAVVTRVLAIPAYLEIARANLTAGKRAARIPDRRVVQRDGIDGSRANAEYFRAALPASAAGYLGSRPFAQRMLAQIGGAGNIAAAAWESFAAFLAETYDVNEPVDRYAIGEQEYEWRVRTVFGDTRSAAELYDYGAQQVALYTARIVQVAREFAEEARMSVSFATPESRNAAVRAVLDFLSRDAPRDDEQLFRWYRSAAERAVAYGREHNLFDVPASYRLDILPTPPVLRSTIDAAYYPPPPFKQTGVGRFYLTPTGNDPAALRLNNFASVADTAVHEGFPGHDWHDKYMKEHAAQISNIRWLTPGAVEDSSAMWSDSMAAEGWALYAEELMAEPVPNHPYGFYSAGEYLYELQGQLLRAVRVRVDVGIHTGRMTFDEAVDYFTEHVSFAPGARAAAALGDSDARAIAGSATRAIYRYSKWPTQAITYNLGKNDIIELREECRALEGSGFSAKRFHERFMLMGTVPVPHFREEFLEECLP